MAWSRDQKVLDYYTPLNWELVAAGAKRVWRMGISGVQFDNSGNLLTEEERKSREPFPLAMPLSVFDSVPIRS